MRAPTSILYALTVAAGITNTNADPVAPPLTYLLTAHVDAGDTIVVGPEDGGTRVALPINGGTFSGPLLNGTIAATGVDAGLYTADNKFYPDGISVFETSDGAKILWRDHGYQTSDTIYGSVTFSTGSEKYSWLNTVVAISSAAFGTGNSSTVGVDIFIVGNDIAY
ncbi:hypothetical protein M406DRAFT_355303 [Cryphonectria parasitica EP155]|uniref:Uncharacterized protein n=1 Tax=Cryphonectria parasitica (strain ATCC 38755 / EP155) TaxID=660469 RepID=A0A9P4Y551_CRYP1|nr:uncharacterized protein M406DRAFT_355303 [Cryphonectria parasitica EP155]KAF3766649.1 hypothetical protein M406DRAFT_355303 [Cryphonectria parasitica EP155]